MQVINWFNVPEKLVDINEFNKELENVLNNDFKKIKQTDIKKEEYFFKRYQIINNESYYELRYIDSEIKKIRYRKNGKVENSEKAGLIGYNLINDLFREKYGKKKSIKTAFSSPKYKDIYKKIKKCVITQIDYARETILGQKLKNCFKSDISSAYPAQLIKKLPTLHGYKLLKGKIEPTKEYPFAFYLNSHHVKIYNELYTQDLKNSKFYSPYYNFSCKWKPNDSLKDEDEETILCKASEYSLKEIFEKMYLERKDNPEIKLAMVASIGYFHKNTNPVLSHIAAVVLARCAKEMIEKAEELYSEGNKILLINTDAIIWQGKQSKISKKEKKLGNFCIEYENVEVLIKTVKAYQILLNDGTVYTRYAGIKKEIQNTFNFGDIMNINTEGGISLIYPDDNGFLISKNLI